MRRAAAISSLAFVCLFGCARKTDPIRETIDAVVKAANARDAAKAGPIIDSLDGVCEGCHLDYWYPDQKALVEKIIKENK